MMQQRPLQASENHLMYALAWMVPHWRVQVQGPTVLGHTFAYTIDGICHPTLEIAIEKAWGHIQDICTQHNYPFNPDEWSFPDIRIINGN